MLTRAQVRDDRALERRTLRKVVDLRRDAVEDKAKNVGIAVVAIPNQREAAPKPHDVRIRREVLGKLRIK